MKTAQPDNNTKINAKSMFALFYRTRLFVRNDKSYDTGNERTYKWPHTYVYSLYTEPHDEPEHEQMGYK